MKEASTTRELTQYKEVANRGKDPQAAQVTKILIVLNFELKRYARSNCFVNLVS